MKKFPLYLSPEHPCSYRENQIAQSAFVHPHFQLTTASYRILLEHGFRRSGGHVYSPHCNACSSCTPVRIPVTKFKPNRAQKRTSKKNQNTTVNIKPALFEEDHYQLYLKYQQVRHHDGSMAKSSREEFIDFLSSPWCDTHFVEFHINHRLVAVGIVDIIDNALSAVYTFFDPDYSAYSLGNYAVLWQIEVAQKQQLQWLYLGFWISDCRKMSYKTQYRPYQLYSNQQWLNTDKNDPDH